ncbi:putative 1-deoxy-D-xylulose 5-phosphate reductoisomerase [Toxoplasma gondii RUB]|uniref:1-deoxy-D-xylulose 5-phosphate reductoisomerase, apicoplastic n=1 Tax=Toxoplasma gondii RUB TaxID=935652 RepID=A0A086M005_TOXGO|nr:putative 1-deoxy-D-xylulose 5-phosphate reductoisomerase [Toxoplasma gondii RUB]
MPLLLFFFFLSLSLWLPASCASLRGSNLVARLSFLLQRKDPSSSRSSLAFVSLPPRRAALDLYFSRPASYLFPRSRVASSREWRARSLQFLSGALTAPGVPPAGRPDPLTPALFSAKRNAEESSFPGPRGVFHQETQHSLQPCGVPVGSVNALKELLRRTEEDPVSSLVSSPASLAPPASPPSTRVKRLVVLGSTGSIGKSTLEIAREFPDIFQIVGLAAGGSNLALLAEQVAAFRPQYVYLGDSSKVAELQERLNDHERSAAFPRPRLLLGDEGLAELACVPNYDILVSAIVGFKGVLPTLKALEAGKDVALANKEALVAAGPVFRCLLSTRGLLYGDQERQDRHERSHRSGDQEGDREEDTDGDRREECDKRRAKAGQKCGLLLPVDSEHSAIFQALQGVPASCYPPRKLLLTASGGPFRGRTRDELEQVTLESALKHPKWSMGAKITIDSATLMNKGLEVIEAHFAFGCPYSSIEVLVHPQAVIHSAVELRDGATLAQLGLPDMKLPIAYALTWPHRLAAPWSAGVDLTREGSLTFEKPDLNTFGCLGLAYEAGERGGVAPACLNAANEVAVERFRNKEIGFVDIEDTVRHVMALQERERDNFSDVSLQDVFDADHWARTAARAFKPRK